MPVQFGIPVFPIICQKGWRQSKKCSKIVFSEGKVIYISFRRKPNQVIIKARRTTISLHFANNALHNLRTNSFFPDHSFSLRPCFPWSVSTKFFFLPPIILSTERYRRTFVPSIVNILNK